MDLMRSRSAGTDSAVKVLEQGSPRWSLTALAGVALALAMTAFPVAADRASGGPKMHDGMNSQEEKRAMRSLDSDQSLKRRSKGLKRRSSAAAQAVPLDPQLLLMERRRDKGSVLRLADAWYYDYEHNETIRKTIDLSSGDVLSSEVVIGTQLPLVEAEITQAFDVLLASAPDRRALGQAYRAVTGKRFKDRSQVSYKAFIFHPDTVVDGLMPAARRCGVHRCAQMLIYTHDNIALDTAPVVDISTSRVLQNLELRAREIVRRGEAL